jgi:hypothetical protein
MNGYSFIFYQGNISNLSSKKQGLRTEKNHPLSTPLIPTTLQNKTTKAQPKAARFYLTSFQATILPFQVCTNKVAA